MMMYTDTGDPAAANVSRCLQGLLDEYTGSSGDKGADADTAVSVSSLFALEPHFSDGTLLCSLAARVTGKRVTGAYADQPVRRLRTVSHYDADLRLVLLRAMYPSC